jgi:hypothetical protein
MTETEQHSNTSLKEDTVIDMATGHEQVQALQRFRLDPSRSRPPVWDWLVGERLWIDIDLVATREEVPK